MKTTECDRCYGTTCEFSTRKVHKGYTRDELSAAWNKIAPRDHWKDRIAAWIDAADYKVCAAACEFYTATKLDVNYTTCVRHEGAMKTRMYVTALGYRLGPAGDH